MKRRDWHRQALAWALAPWAPGGVQAQATAPRWQVWPFVLGVASGQPQADSVVLWTRLICAPADAALAQQAVPVHCGVFADEALRQPVGQWTLTATPETAHSVHVLARGLSPDRPYWYRFRAGDAQSPVGRTRTAPRPEDPVTRLRLALASCQHYEQGYFVAHREIARQDLDLVLFVGDYIYEGSNRQQQLRPHGSGIPTLLEEYRARHALYKSDPDLQASHAAHVWLMTWDDHEVVNDYARDRDPAFSSPEFFLRRRAAAYRAYFEHMPLRLGPMAQTPSLMRIHDDLAWGQLAHLWTLDNRQYRDHQACPDPRRGGGRTLRDCEALAQPGRTMLGPEQEAWLARGLRESRAHWQVLAQATQMSPHGVDSPEGRLVWSDGWDGYPAARERLLQDVAQSGHANVLVLGGDVHRHVAANLRLRPNDPGSPILASEMVATSVTSVGGTAASMARLLASNPDVQHARADERGYTRIEITREQAVADMRGTPHPARDHSTLARQARFVVRSGQPGVLRED